MFTYQMIGIADENGKTYESKYGTYNKDNGFIFNDTVPELTKSIGWRGFVNKLFHDDLWKLQVESKEMTLADIEKELGYRIRIIDPEPEKKIVSKKGRKEVDDAINFLNRFLGTRLSADDFR